MLKKNKTSKCPIKIDGELLNLLLGEEIGKEVITDDDIKKIKISFGEDISFLKGCKLTSESEGYSKSDGDYCNYIVTLHTVNNNIYYAEDYHCPALGWNFNGIVKFKKK